MQNFLILIDGPKGSGKSTLSELLKNNLSNTEFFSLDNERKLIEKTDSRDNDNKKAFHIITEKLEKNFEQNKSAVVDCGLSSNERVNVLDTISKKYNVEVYKYSLIAHYDVLHSRVKERDKSRGKNFDKERFDYTFNAQQSKSFDGFSIIDSSKLSPQEIFEIVYSKLV